MDAIFQKKIGDLYDSSIASRINLSNAWSCPWIDLEFYPITPTSIVGDDTWLIPEEWCPINRRDPGSRTIDFNKVIPAGWTTAETEGLKRRVKRIAILDRSQSVKGKRNTLSPSTPVTWVYKCQLLIKAARYSLETLSPKHKVSLCPDGPSIFVSVGEDDFKKLKLANPGWANGHIERLNALFSDGYFDDWPAKDVAKHKFNVVEESKATMPFNDIAFTRIVEAAFWLNNILPEILKAYLDTKDLDCASDGGRKRNMIYAYRREQVRSWTSAALPIGTVFPFHIAVSGEKNKRIFYSAWPLDTVVGLKSLLFICQAANAILIAAATGMRIGELTALTRESLVRGTSRPYLAEPNFDDPAESNLYGSNMLKGPSYKGTDVPDGQQRHWPFPQVAVRAFEAQETLSNALSNDGSFWVNFAGVKNLTGVTSLDYGITAFGRSVSCSDGRPLADLDGPISPHRFRYSAARYVALSLTGFSQILFDVLGHSDVEVTLGYALRDRDLHQEINKIRQEVKAIRVKEIFDHADQNGGAAADLVRKLKADMLARSGKDELDTDDVIQGAAILGEAELVKPGVLCTAQKLERGACSPVPGVRDVGACTSSCMHHLELAAHRQTRDNIIECLLVQIKDADTFYRVFCQSQLIANFNPFPDLLTKYENDRRLYDAMVDSDRKTWGVLTDGVREHLERIMAKIP